MQLRNVDLNLLEAFDALMDERSVTRAAARLSLMQPAVRATLNRLLLALARSSDLVALLPRRLLADTAGLRVVAPPLEIPGFTRILAWHARPHDDTGQRWAREQLARACGVKR
jgi:DNA-binding transcriptional LysR family regulator